MSVAGMKKNDFMAVRDLQYGIVETVTLVSVDEGAPIPAVDTGVECTLARPSDADDDYLTLLPDQDTERPPVRRVKGLTREDQQTLDQIMGRNLCRVSYVEMGSRKGPGEGGGQVTIRVHQFRQALTLPEGLDVGVDDKAREDLQSAVPGPADDVPALLQRRLLLPPVDKNGHPRAILCASPEKHLQHQGGFRMLGDGIFADIARDDQDKWGVKRVGRGHWKGAANTSSLALVTLDLQFKDASTAEKSRGVTPTVLQRLARQRTSYLLFWKNYNRMERASVCQQALRFGRLRYGRAEYRQNNTWRFHLLGAGDGDGSDTRAANALQRLAENHLTLVASDQSPSHLPAQSEAAPDTSACVSRNASGHPLLEVTVPTDQVDEDGLAALRAQEGQGLRFRGTYVAHEVRGGEMLLELRALDPNNVIEPPKKGVLTVSVLGDDVRLTRRSNAEKAIRRGRNGMPHLGLLLENQPIPVSRHRRIPVKRSTVQDLFGAPPTPAQLKAIEIALNTPDIAVIQGPFGTGKTQVIAAIEELLARQEDTPNLHGSILLTSYQHDAVENAISRSTILGLPVMKVGKRRGERENRDPARGWRQAQVERLKKEIGAHADTRLSQLRRETALMAIAYVRNPETPGHVQADLRKLHAMVTGHVPTALLDEITEAAEKMTAGQAAATDDRERSRLLKAVYGLRTTQTSFLDDGPRNADKILVLADRSPSLATSLSRADRDVLERAAGWEDGAPLDFLPDLERLRQRLLDWLDPAPRPPVTPLPNPDIEALFAKVADALGDKEARSLDGITSALLDYLEDLERDPIATADTLARYTAVLAATCQQSAASALTEKKRGSPHQATFDTVVVDEAARANPLDLFIPMALARRRIILVGDHKQLPHLLEPDLERELEESADTLTLRALKESLFQRLYDQLQRKEQEDGRKRTIMLDVQFRMHPKLGRFLSAHFYAGRIRSGRPKEEFAHDLPGYSGTRLRDGLRRSVDPESCMAWLHVPLAHGTELGGFSKRRPVEAKVVAQEVLRLLKACKERSDPVQRDFTFGVIAFYRAQVEEIRRELARELGAGTAGVHDPSITRRSLVEGEHQRLSVGTVDAFQGKEYDVVILSMTRANKVPERNEQDLRSRFGHLMLPNRMNVAMSRQKRLLIVAGAAEMLQGEKAREAIRPLVDFHAACEKHP